MKILCEIYKSRKREGLYLYVEKTEGFNRVPSELLQQIDQDKSVMTLLLTPERKLSRADVNKVMNDIQEKGFYLQLPPSEVERVDNPPLR